jgi:hypothetical protein
MSAVHYNYIRVLVAEVRGPMRRVEIIMMGNAIKAPIFFARADDNGIHVIKQADKPNDLESCIELAKSMSETYAIT